MCRLCNFDSNLGSRTMQLTNTLTRATSSPQPRVLLSPEKSHDAIEFIPEQFRKGLDPEWVELWVSHGRRIIPASEVSIEEYRLSPAKYSFTYPVWKGENDQSVPQIARKELNIR